MMADLGRVDDFPAGEGRTRQVGGREVAVFNLDGELVALDGRCHHKGGPVGDGHVRDGIVTCPRHWWRYDIRTGCLVGRPEVSLERFPLRVSGGRVLVDVPPAPPEEPWRERLLRLAHEEGAR